MILIGIHLILGVAAFVAAVWALIAMGHFSPAREIELPSPENDWRNEDYAEHEKGGKLRSQWVSPETTPSA